MRPYYLFLFMLFTFANVSSAQMDSSEYRRTYNSQWNTSLIYAGYHMPVNKGLQSVTNGELGSQIETIGIHFRTGPLNYNEDNAPGIGFEYYLPSQFVKQSGDILKLSGFRFSFPLWLPYNFNVLGRINQVKHFQYALLIDVPRIGVGSYFLRAEEFNRNFFSDISGGLRARLVFFEHLVLGANIRVNWDFTAPYWKSKKGTVNFGNGFKTTGYSTFITAGWIFNNQSNYARIYF